MHTNLTSYSKILYKKNGQLDLENLDVNQNAHSIPKLSPIIDLICLPRLPWMVILGGIT